MKKTRTFLFLAALLSANPLAANESLSDYQRLPFTLQAVQDRIIPIDFDGDGRLDLLLAAGNKISLHLQRKDASKAPFDFDKADSVLELPGSATGWSLDKLGGREASAGQRLVALVDGKQLLAWRWQDGGFGKAEQLLDGVAGFLPSGAHPMDFVRDINGDGLSDVIVPGPEQLEIYLQTEDGGYADALRVESRMINYSRLQGGADLTTQVGQRIRIPQLNVRDLNNDGHNDLIASSDERVAVFLADKQGRFPAQASYAVNLNELQERVGEVDFNSVDYSNLSGLLSYTYDVQVEDVDGDKIEDLLVREGGKLTLFGGTASGMNMEQPRQVLKSSGNVLGTMLRDEDEDGLKDLWLIRLQDISLGNLFLWLAISGSVDLETYVYKNSGERFASRPHRKVTLTMKFPSILRSVDMVSAALDVDKQVDVTRTVRSQLDDDKSNELAVLLERSVAVFMNAIATGSGDSFLGLSDYSRKKNNYVYDLGQVLANPASGANRDLQKVQGLEADFRIPYRDGEGGQKVDFATMDLVARDLNGDGRDDFFVLTERDENSVTGVLLLSR